MRRILITGASGYLSRFIVERLSGRYHLTLFDCVPPVGPAAACRFLQGDVTDYAQVHAACTGQDAVVHTVALVRGRRSQSLSTFADVMVKGTWHVAEACARTAVRRLVNISSIVARGAIPPGEQLCHTSDPCDFREGDLFYCLAKHLSEQIGLAYHQAHGLSVIHLRPGVIAGDGANPGPAPPKPPARGRWFVYVDPRDVAQAVELALGASGLAYGCYNIVAGRSDSLLDWAAAEHDLGYRPQFNWPEIPETC